MTGKREKKRLREGQRLGARYKLTEAETKSGISREVCLNGKRGERHRLTMQQIEKERENNQQKEPQKSHPSHPNSSPPFSPMFLRFSFFFHSHKRNLQESSERTFVISETPLASVIGCFRAYRTRFRNSSTFFKRNSQQHTADRFGFLES